MISGHVPTATGRNLRLASMTLVGASLSACAASGLPTLGLPTAAELNVAAPPSGGPVILQGSSIVGSPTEVYTRVAHGALTCWFGAAGPLKASYLYHAEADPPSRGGKSEIAIFIKDPAAADPRALRAYRVAIATVDGNTKVEIENAKMPDALASRLNGDVGRWAADDQGCAPSPISSGWSPQDQPVKKAAGKVPRK